MDLAPIGRLLGSRGVWPLRRGWGAASVIWSIFCWNLATMDITTTTSDPIKRYTEFTPFYRNTSAIINEFSYIQNINSVYLDTHKEQGQDWHETLPQVFWHIHESMAEPFPPSGCRDHTELRSEGGAEGRTGTQGCMSCGQAPMMIQDHFGSLLGHRGCQNYQCICIQSGLMWWSYHHKPPSLLNTVTLYSFPSCSSRFPRFYAPWFLSSIPQQGRNNSTPIAKMS